jgi:hypothetical protein
MKSIWAAAAFAVAMTGVAASAQEAQEAEEAPREKKICRTERATGSLTRRTRICLTEAQWRELNSRTYKGVSDMQGQASGSQAVANNPGPGGPGS